MELITNSWPVKYRPERLDGLIGNDTITNFIEGMIERKDIPNTLFITGPYGTGKTTTARIIARYLNCESLSACGECPSCKIPLENHPDYKEVNAADKRGIDEVRAVIAESKFKPSKGNLRIIVLDEVHAITGQASSAILKPLEESPPHTLFILVTSEPQNVLDTIVSRGVHLEVKTPGVKDIARRLYKICKIENVSLPKEVLLQIAEACGGHVRNAIGMLEICAMLPEGADYNAVIKSTPVSVSEKLDGKAQKILVGMYLNRISTVTKTLADIDDGEWMGLISKLMFFNQYLIDLQYQGQNKNIWHTEKNRHWVAYASKHCEDVTENLTRLIDVANTLVNLKTEMTAFIVPERLLFTARLAKF